jgi:hypothetical protein
MSAGIRTASMALLAVAAVLFTQAAPAQEAPAQPRTPMGPGSGWKNKALPGELHSVPTMAPPHLGGVSPSNQVTPNLAGQEADAINVLKEKKADVVVLSKANASALTMQLYHPEQDRWQEYQLAPRTMTCRGAFGVARVSRCER